MAYQTKPRSPLLESDMQEAIRKRGTELIGLGLIAAAIAMSMMLATYHAEDPSWLTATSEPAQNALGSIGAAIANPLVLTIGWAAWFLPLFAFVWGARALFHLGEKRALFRAVFAPIAVALSAVFLACHVPVDSWSYGFGLGGLFGDAVLGVLVDLNPISLGLGVTLITMALGVVAVSLCLFVLGFTLSELRSVLAKGWRAIILTYASLLGLVWFVLGNSVKAGAAVKAKRAGRLERQRQEAQEAEILAQQLARSAPMEEPVVTSSQNSLLRKLPKIRFRRTEPEFEPSQEPELMESSGTNTPQDRVSSRISEAISNKIMQARTAQDPETRIEPVVSAEMENSETAAPRLGGVSRDLADEVPELGLEPASESVWAGADDASEPKSVVQHTPHKTPARSTRAKAEEQPSLSFEEKDYEYEMPPLSLLTKPKNIVRNQMSDEALAENARMLEAVLDDYGVKGEITSVRPGPVVTMYELEPAPGLKASRVIGLADDIARSMSALAARVSTVPGRTVIGIELPNPNRETVFLREILASRDFGDGNQSLPLALGKDIGGESIVSNLAKMPHLLIAGTTGSGKSVAINTMIVSLLYKLRPEECRMIMIDPKMLELSVYDGIPHLLSPVVTDPKKAVVALKWVVCEMEERYRKMSKMGVRNISGYNSRVEHALAKGEDFSRTVQTGFDDETGDPVFETETFTPEKIPFIVVIVDEMADLMMVAGKEIEACIQRLAQMARASGIHLIMATQRPSVDVITGTIKANFPTRISFQVTSKIDSRTILGEMGAEQLLGMGDMLYMEGGGRVTRVHGPFVSDEEVEEVVKHLKAFGSPEYNTGIIEGPAEEKSSDIDMVLGLGNGTSGEDALYDQAVAIVLNDRKCSTSYIQRKLAIGYNKAARLVEQMEDEGVVSSANHVGKREILVPEQH